MLRGHFLSHTTARPTCQDMVNPFQTVLAAASSANALSTNFAAKPSTTALHLLAALVKL